MRGAFLAAFRACLALTIVAAAATACGRAQGQAPAANTGAPRIQLSIDPSGSPTIEVTGLPAADLTSLEHAAPTPDEWTRLLRVQVATNTASGSASGDTPSVLGRYSVRDGVIRFTPRFPLEPGTRYEVALDLTARQASEAQSEAWGDEGAPLGSPYRVRTTLQVPMPHRPGAATRIVEVYPSAPELPENQLRMYITFSAPMGLLDGAPYIRLLDDRGQVVVDPFLPLDVNLWNDDRTRYTLLFDPGRQKRGILPNEQMGRSLIEGRTYTLVVDAGWPDGTGRPLETTFERRFRVSPPVEHAIDPSAWRLDPPAAGTRDALTMRFPRPLDYALLQRTLRVATATGAVVAGQPEVRDAETRWIFTPRDLWEAGDYRVVAADTLEDVAGNRIGRPFEVSMLHVTRGPAAPPASASGAAIPFQIARRVQ